MVLEHNKTGQDNRKFIKAVEEFNTMGSMLFLDDRLASQNSLRAEKSSIWEEVVKLPFYLSVPTKSNFIFQKRKFVFFVFLGCFGVISLALRLVSWKALVAALVLSLLLLFVNTVSSKTFIFNLNEFFAVAAVIAWAVLFSNVAFSALSFSLDDFAFGQSWLVYPLTALTDWNFS